MKEKGKEGNRERQKRKGKGRKREGMKRRGRKKHDQREWSKMFCRMHKNFSPL